MAEKPLERQCLACEGKDLLVLTCNNGYHHLCLQCLSLWLRSKTNEADSFNYRCPMYNECQSDFDPDIINDILLQFPENYLTEIKVESMQKLSVNSALRNDKTVSCPTCPFFWTEETDLVELFTSCYACKTTFCATCKHTLGRYSYLDHVCPVESSNKHRTVHDVAEILTEASIFKCKNSSCEDSRNSTPITKQMEDCNVVRCRTCETFYCYICTKNLGVDYMEAHRRFPHKNVLVPGAPMCWVVDDKAKNQTTEEALNLRKLHRLTEYFISLPMSKNAKQRLVHQCRHLLGDLCEKIISEINYKCKILESKGKCTIA